MNGGELQYDVEGRNINPKINAGIANSCMIVVGFSVIVFAVFTAF